MDFQVAIIGAGVVGLAVARDLSLAGMEVIVIEKNAHYGQEMSSRNSEVIHAGIYYPPDSKKSKLCNLGKQKLYKYLEEKTIPHNKCGKIIVATDDLEKKQLKKIKQNANNAGVNDLTWLDKSDLKDLEPNISGIAGLLSPSSGIIDAHSYMDSLVADLRAAGGEIVLNSALTSIKKTGTGYLLTIEQDQHNDQFECRWVINSAGLYADKIAQLAGIDIYENHYSLHWCKGNYFRLSEKPEFKLKHLIYPVPPQNLSGLGVHATLDLSGSIKFGPDVNYLSEKKEDFEVDKEKIHDFTRSVRRYMPQITEKDLSPDMAGIRAKRQGPGDDFRDFVISHETHLGLNGLINLIGIESPGLTASLAIAEYVKELILCD